MSHEEIQFRGSEAERGPVNLTHRCEYCAGGECEIWASGGWITAARCSNCGMEHSHLVGMVADPEETTEDAQ